MTAALESAEMKDSEFDMPIVIIKAIDNDKLESVLRRLEQHKPVTCFGATIRAGIRSVIIDRASPHPCVHNHSRALMENAKEYRVWLAENGALLDEPKE